MFHGPRQAWVEARLRERFTPTHLEVVNESHGPKENESHFFACIVSEEFEGKKALDRHRLVNAALQNPDGTLPFHALRIAAKTPAQWDADSRVPPAPRCAGGDK
ncbi:hypothetical protein CTAYLR_009288 [Chrysophaeum taylorii]|uniref:BolA-like protein n=1 Tax=Chrysophaeum taylorii TaxID=2483200 RepID=A0AAD7UM01_9STRA|nr:hypothetical protein CTAYLR_009288 [Chrysophaeum taylorii]